MGNKQSKNNKDITEQGQSSKKQAETNNLDLFDEKQPDEKQPNESCSSITNCQSINMIIKYLKIYQDSKPENLRKSFHKQIIAYLQNSFNHILIHHLGDEQSIDKTTKEYEEIYDFMTKTNDFRKCSIEKCIKFQRNNRSRETQNIFLQTKDAKHVTNNNDIDHELECLIEFMDTLHCFFIHTFDVGFRVRTNELTDAIGISNDEKKEVESDEEYDIASDRDVIMKKLSTLVKEKRAQLENIRGLNRISNSKFVTQFTAEEQKQTTQNTDKQTNIDSYSFGHEYNYWNKNSKVTKVSSSRKLRDSNYVSSKYMNLKDELLNNKIFTIDVDNFDSAEMTVRNKMDSTAAKTLIAERVFGIHAHTIKEGSKITMEHLLALYLYTSFDSLSYNFSSTFRSLNNTQTFKDCMLRNAEYAIWAKLLSETVNVWGTTVHWFRYAAAGSRIKVYYHGINCLLYFTSFVTTFNSPTSTSPQIAVATIFAKKTGVILELTKDSPALRYFNCAWISSYANEDERLFILPGNPNTIRLQIASIRLVGKQQNYNNYVHAMTALNHVIDNPDITVDESNEEVLANRVKKRDVKIINRLLNHSHKPNKFPEYINSLFDIFTKNKNMLRIKNKSLDFEYKLFKSLLVNENNFININRICKIFENCTSILISFNEGESLTEAATNLGFISSSRFENLLLELTDLNKCNNQTLKFIFLRFIEWEEDTFSVFKAKFNQINWEMGTNKQSQSEKSKRWIKLVHRI
eukprot:166709_1